MPMDLLKMSRKELLELRADIDKALVAAEERERKSALKAAQDAAAEFGFSLEELSGVKAPAKRRAAAKYRNPAEPSQTWSGLGRKPKWLHEALANGANISDLEI